MLSACMLSLMIGSIIAALLLIVPLADLYGRKIVNLALGATLIITVSLLVASIEILALWL